MARPGVSKLVLLALVLAGMLVAAFHVEAANLTCAEVTVWLTPCISYGVVGGTVPPLCCQGIKTLNKAQNTPEDRRLACNCIKDGAANIPGINYDRINQLGSLCGSKCPYKVYPTTDCSKVK